MKTLRTRTRTRTWTRTWFTGTAAAVAAVLAAAALLLVLPALAQPPAGGPGAGGPGFGPGAGFGHGFGRGAEGLAGEDSHGLAGRFLARLARYLELTGEQVAQAKAIHEQARADLQPLRETARALRTELRDLLARETPDATAVGQKVIAVQDNREAMRQVAAEAKAAFRALLTAEQLEKLEALAEVRRFFGGHGPGGGGPGAHRGGGGAAVEGAGLGGGFPV